MTELKEVFTNNFKAALASIGIEDYNSETFIITTNPEPEKWTSMDNIYRMWTTPLFTGIRLNFDAVIESLVNEKKKVAPIRIKIYKEDNSKPIVLEISQRFRKLRDLALRKRDNQTYPFEVIDESEYRYSETKERTEAVRILFFRREYDNYIQSIIGNKISHREVIDFFNKHFKKYQYYPAIYNHATKDDDNRSSLVIQKTTEPDQFNLFQNTELKENYLAI